MKIIKPVNKGDRELHQVTPGQVFEFEGMVFMKLQRFNTNMTNYNAINLTTCKFSCIPDNFTVLVHPNAELHLK